MCVRELCVPIRPLPLFAFMRLSWLRQQQQQHDRGDGEEAGVGMGRGSGLLMLRAVVCL